MNIKTTEQISDLVQLKGILYKARWDIDGDIDLIGDRAATPHPISSERSALQPSPATCSATGLGNGAARFNFLYVKPRGR